MLKKSSIWKDIEKKGEMEFFLIVFSWAHIFVLNKGQPVLWKAHFFYQSCVSWCFWAHSLEKDTLLHCRSFKDRNTVAHALWERAFFSQHLQNLTPTKDSLSIFGDRMKFMQKWINWKTGHYIEFLSNFWVL